MFLLVAVLLAGCRPTCNSVCIKVRGCSLSPEQAQAECVQQCRAYDSEYDTDDALNDRWVAHLQCVSRSTCAEIEDGVCYDEDSDLYGF